MTALHGVFKGSILIEILIIYPDFLTFQKTGPAWGGGGGGCLKDIPCMLESCHIVIGELAPF